MNVSISFLSVMFFITFVDDRIHSSKVKPGPPPLTCLHNRTEAGLCVWNSDSCCQAFMGSQCRWDISFDREPAPQLDASGVKLSAVGGRFLCLENLRIKNGGNTNSLVGIYVEVELYVKEEGLVHDLELLQQEFMFTDHNKLAPESIFCSEFQEVSLLEYIDTDAVLEFILMPLQIDIFQSHYPEQMTKHVKNLNFLEGFPGSANCFEAPEIPEDPTSKGRKVSQKFHIRKIDTHVCGHN